MQTLYGLSFLRVTQVGYVSYVRMFVAFVDDVVLENIKEKNPITQLWVGLFGGRVAIVLHFNFFHQALVFIWQTWVT